VSLIPSQPDGPRRGAGDPRTLARCESLAGRHHEAVAHSSEALELARQKGLRQRDVTSAEETHRMAEAAAAEHAEKPDATSAGR